MLRLATWNVNSLKARLPRVEEWIDQVQPDVLCMQETKLADGAFPDLTFRGLGYECAHHGEGRWNGVAILSKVGLDEVRAGWDDAAEPDPEARQLWATCGGVRVATVYVPNGRSLDADHYTYKLGWLERLRTTLDAHEDPSGHVVVCGDFNIAPDDRDVYDPAAFQGETHVSPPERAALERSSSGASTTCSAATTTRPGSTRGGTTAAATSTRAEACASTSCSPRRRSPLSPAPC